MNILLTGSTGFLGSHIYNQLIVNNEIIEIVRKTRTNNKNNIVCDLAAEVPEIGEGNIDAVVHCAGLAHYIPKSKVDKANFYNRNVAISSNLLLALQKRKLRPRYFIYISSVAVYGLEKGTSIEESSPLNAKDPYGLSKIKSEEIIKEWCDENQIVLTILRPALIVGDKPLGNLGAMISAIKKGYYARIVGNTAQKSAVLASDIADVIPRAFEIGGIYNLSDGRDFTFRELEKVIKQSFGVSKKTFLIPLFAVKFVAKIGDLIEYVTGKSFLVNSNKLNKITCDLTFSSSLATLELGWKPRSILDFYLNIKK
ncbi:NAD-dependent epimerase/dehydratase family protein [uncultured Arcticibacterium sp.]|uniref:NAD-dependent epimerase/dehydratase family protein n=1 Tax=uncultured Arcticibacterium sp. TaxID=2173042 RepID=UPI0030F57BD2